MQTTDFYTEKNTVFCRALAEVPFLSHGFSTRNGGTSALDFTKSLNLAYCRGDDDKTVNENRRIFAANAGFDIGGLVLAEQIHSTNVVTADGGKKRYNGADGFVTSVPGVFVAVKTADCQPILFADTKNRVVGACHAGWRGAAHGIAAKTVEKMISEGARAENVIAALGPCIMPCCFEVREDFIKELQSIDGQLMKFITERGGGFYADLPGINKYFLLSSGIRPDNIYVSGECTCCDEEKYFSHRRDGSRRGTMMSVIGIKKQEV